jgi:hypothetical protein
MWVRALHAAGDAVVEELRKLGHVTGMTGDGVNDAPALKRADIGIAVEGATDAAKAAADIVLVEPGLSVIIYVSAGRGAGTPWFCSPGVTSSRGGPWLSTGHFPIA